MNVRLRTTAITATVAVALTLAGVPTAEVAAVATGSARTPMPTQTQTQRPPHRLIVSQQRDGQLDLWAINDDGSRPVRLTTDRLDDQQPAVSRDGRRIAFVRGVAFDSVPPSSDLWIMDADGGNERLLVAGIVWSGVPRAEDGLTRVGPVETAEYRPSFSPDGTRVLFTRHTGLVSQSIWVVPVDGSAAPTMIVDDATYAHWGPDGRIAYVADPDGDSQIAVAEADGSGSQAITTRGGVAPQWSPDGSRIVFTSFRNGRGQLFVINADGTGERQLESDDVPRTAGFGTWSPDGARIAFSSTRDMSCAGSEYRDCARRVFTINADGTGVRMLPTGSDLDQYPAYTPLRTRRR